MRLSIYEILKAAGEAKGTKAKAAVLQAHTTPSLEMIIKYALDPQIKWLLPETNPPFKKMPYVDQHGRLHAEARRLYLFIAGGNDSLKQAKREQLFIQLLESLDPNDAALLLEIKNKKLPFGITRTVVNAAFPGLLSSEKKGE